MTKFVRIVTALSGVALLAVGVWAFFAPRSFYTGLATYPPYNEHFIHDLGALQIGAGSALLLALAWVDGLSVVLIGIGTGSAFHFIAHLTDRDLGGKASDPVLTGAGAAALLLAAALRRRTVGDRR